MSNPIKSLVSACVRYFGLLALFGICFLAFHASAAEAGNDAGTNANPTSTPVKKTTPKKAGAPNVKPAATPTPKATPKPTPKPELAKVIVSVTAARVRTTASTASAEIRKLKLGTVLSVLEKPDGANVWYKVQLPADSKVATGWMSSTVVSSFDTAKAETTYRQLTTKTYKEKGLSYSDAVELYEFLSRVTPELKTPGTAAELNLKRLQSLAIALNKIPIMKSDEEPYKAFAKAQEKYITYSDPAGQYFVNAELFWDLHKKYSGTVIGEEIAWAGAKTPIPGECEGYLNCYLYLLRETDGRYLHFYPDGKHSLEALKNIAALLDPIVADLKDKKVYDGPTDVSDRAEYNKQLSELRSIISKVPLVDKDKVLRQISQLAEAYR